jgi:integrase
MLAILRNHPIRRKNLLALRLDTHLDRSANGRTYLVVAEKDVKNRRGIEFEVDPALWDMIERHVALRSAAGRNPACPWLFPDAAGDGPLHESYVSSRLSRVIARELGVAFNMHLARHLAAYLFLLKKPGHYEAVRRLLAHSSTSVTLDAYAGFETDSVGRQYGDFIAEARRQGGTGRDR